MFARIATGAVLGLATLLANGTAGASVGPGSAASPVAPAKVTAKPTATGIAVHWSRVPGRPTFSVTSTPPGKGCTTTALTCTIPVDDTVPWTFSVTATAAGATSAPSAPTTAVRVRRILVVAGASNAVGFESYAIDPTTRANYFAAPYASPTDASSTLVWLPWVTDPAPRVVPVPLRTPQRLLATTPVIGGRQVFGPELGLARQLYADTGESVTIVKVGVPANLYNFWKGGPKPSDAVNHTATLVGEVMAYEAHKGRLPVISGVFWAQGESDTNSATWAGAYQGRLTQLVASLHAVLPMASTTPFVIAKISTTAWWEGLAAGGACPAGGSDCSEQLAADATVRAAEDAVAGSDPTVRTVDTVDLARTGVMLHLSNVSELAMGRRMALAAEPLLP
jgi:hypothetical protein